MANNCLLLTVPAKGSFELDVRSLLSSMIESNYNILPNKKIDFEKAVTELASVRSKFIIDSKPDESNLNIAYWYYDQVQSLEDKLLDTEINIPFKWSDAFDRGSMFAAKFSLTIPSLAYEKVCVLFNIAALQSSVAASQSLESDESRKLSAKLLQQSAGIFEHLSHSVMPCLKQDLSPDMNPETLSALSTLMLAQAQEIFVQKAIQDNMKDAVVAKLSAQCDDLYAEALKQMQKETLKCLWDKDWVPTVSGKQAGYHGLTQYYQSRVCNSNKKIGEEIARLEHALAMFKKSKCKTFAKYVDLAEQHLQTSKKDNDFIYHERIPDVSSLPSPSKAALAKLLPLPKQMSPDFRDSFDKLLPITVQRALVNLNLKNCALVALEMERLKEATRKLNSMLSIYTMPEQQLTSLAAQQLRTELDKIDVLREERQGLETKLQQTDLTNMEGVLLEMWGTNGKLHEEELFSEYLSKTFGPLQASVNNNIQRQAVLELEVTRAGSELRKEMENTNKQCIVM